MRTEKEKMLAEDIYDANNDEALLKERALCKELCYEYNHLHPAKTIEREMIIRKLFHKTGKSFIIEPTFFCDYGYNIEVGENFYANHNLVILDGAKVTFGDNVFIAPNCSFYTAGHPLNVAERNRGLEYAYPITIGDNVWIAGGVTVLPGVSIGSGSTIGAGSVVTKDIPENSLALGNPCKVIRKL